MPKLKIDVCDTCDQVLSTPKSGLIIEGENIVTNWGGRGSPSEDLFQKDGQYAPMNGRISLTICLSCLKNVLFSENPFVK